MSDDAIKDVRKALEEVRATFIDGRTPYAIAKLYDALVLLTDEVEKLKITHSGPHGLA